MWSADTAPGVEVANRQPPTTVPSARLEAYDRLVASQPGLERKGASLPYTSINGHMSSFVDGTGVAIRLASTDRAAFIERFGSRLHEAHGAIMKEFVTVPDALLDDPATLQPWFTKSRDHVASLRPKRTRRAAEADSR
jgi:hypothetical protein